MAMEKPVRIPVTLPHGLYEQLRRAAWQEQDSMAALIRDALENYLTEREAASLALRVT